MMNYICQERLRWSSPEHPAPANGVPNGAVPAAIQGGPIPPIAFHNPRPFADPEDYKILRNDWPYGLDPGIVHLVVWLRTPIPVKSQEGHLTDESRAMIEEFVRKKFVRRLAEDAGKRFSDPEGQVLWFKNWVGLQSVRALEHVHILVRDVPEDILAEWSGEQVQS